MRRTTLGTVGVALAALMSCGKEGPPPEELLAKRELAAAYYEEERYLEARDTIQWILDSGAAEARDVVNMACVELELGNYSEHERPRELLAEAREMDAKLAAAYFVLGGIESMIANFEKALELYERAKQLAPDDVPSQYQYGSVLGHLGRIDEAEQALQSIVDQGVEFTGSFHLSALWRLAGVKSKSKDASVRDRATELRVQAQALLDEGLPRPNNRDLLRGYLGRIEAPPRPNRPASAPLEPLALTFESVGDVFAEAGTIHDLIAIGVDKDDRIDLVAVTDTGAFLALQQNDASFAVRPIATGPYTDMAAGDVANWGRASLLFFGEGDAVFLAPDEDLDYTPVDLGLGTVRAAVFVDVDHEGDLDLVVADDRGLRLLRNDGLTVEPDLYTTEGVTWTDSTEGSGLPQGAFDWIVIDDFDVDKDIDLLAGGASVDTVLVSNLRAGTFEALPSSLTGLPGQVASPAAVRDLDHDSRPDIVVGGRIHKNLGDLRFEASGDAPASAVLADVDLDGHADMVSTDGDLTVRRGPLLGSPATAESLPDDATGAAWIADVDTDGDPDLIIAKEQGVEVFRSGTSPRHRALRLDLEGKKDNRSAVGAIVEVRGGTRYERQLCDGRPVSFGVGSRPGARSRPRALGQRRHPVRDPAGVRQDREG